MLGRPPGDWSRPAAGVRGMRSAGNGAAKMGGGKREQSLDHVTCQDTPLSLRIARSIGRLARQSAGRVFFFPLPVNRLPFTPLPPSDPVAPRTVLPSGACPILAPCRGEGVSVGAPGGGDSHGRRSGFTVRWGRLLLNHLPTEDSEAPVIAARERMNPTAARLTSTAATLRVDRQRAARSTGLPSRPIAELAGRRRDVDRPIRRQEEAREWVLTLRFAISAPSARAASWRGGAWPEGASQYESAEREGRT